jgi:hypothetical protein
LQHSKSADPTTKSAKVGAKIISTPFTPDASSSSGRTQDFLLPLKRRLLTLPEEQLRTQMVKRLTFLDPKIEASSPEKIDPIQEMIGTMPFTLLATSVIHQNNVACIEEFVQKSLPGMLYASLRVIGVVKSIPERPIVPGLCIKCRKEGPGDNVEVCVRHLVQVGGSKEVYRQVYLYGSKRGQVYAYAKPRKESSSLQRGFHERRLIEMRHEILMSGSLPPDPSLVPMKEVMHRRGPKRLKGLTMPWCEKGDLYIYLQKNRPNEFFCLKLAQTIAEGLQVIHANKKCHLDLKSGNILLQENGRPLIGDFGRMYEQGLRVRFPISTHSCLAPEQIAEYATVDPSADMWGFGLILLEIVHGVKANRYILLGQGTAHADLETPSKHPALRAAWIATREMIVASLQDQAPIDQIIKRLLNEDPKLRPTAQEVRVEIDTIINKKILLK